ncbi:MAG: hypothetical protein VB082_08690 [Christensenella sp.]|nr:hypothetical protein [Christensenella sp.]
MQNDDTGVPAAASSSMKTIICFLGGIGAPTVLLHIVSIHCAENARSARSQMMQASPLPQSVDGSSY